MGRPENLVPLVVSMREAARLLSCSRNIVFKLLRAGELRSYLERGRRKITTESIQALIDRRLAASNGGEFRLSEMRNKRRAA